MKKILKIAIGFIAVVVLLLFSLPLLFTEKVEAIIKEEGNKMLNAEFDFKDLDISLLRQFPRVSVSIEDFYIKGIGTFEKDTLLEADEITASVNLMSLFGDGGYEINKILLDGVKVKALVLADGTVNWDVMKPTEEAAAESVPEDTLSADAPIRILLKKLVVEDFALMYDDRQAAMSAAVNGLDAILSGDFGSSRTLLDVVADASSVTYTLEGVPFLNKARVKADMEIDADLENNKFIFSDNVLQLNAIKAAIDGWVALTDAGMDMDLKLNSNKVGFKEILSLVPAIYAQDFEGLKADGVASLTAYAKGSLEGENVVPEFNLAFDVKNAMFRYPDLPAGVDNINISVNVSNPGGSPDATVVKVSPFNFVMAGNPFSIALYLKNPVSDLLFDAEAKGRLDLGKIKDIYPLEDMNLNGIVDADISIDGRMSYIEKELYDKIKASGTVALKDMQLEMEDIPTVDIKRSLLTFTPRYLQLSETAVNMGKNDIVVDSKFENYIGYAVKGSTLKGTLNLKSNRFNLNDFMTGEGAAESDGEETASTDSVATGIIEVPENIDFTMQAAFKQVLFDNMVFDNLNGLLVVKDRKVDMKNLSMNTMGGDVVVNGFYYTPQNAQPQFKGGFKLNKIVFAKAYNDLNVVRKLAPIFNGLTGDFSGNVNIDTKLDDAMSPVLQTLDGSGALSTKDLSLNNVKVIQTVADIVQKPSLKDTRVKDLNLEFTIKEGKVSTKPFDIKLGDYKMKLSGSTGLDQTIDYKGEITIPASAGKVAQLGTVDMNIGGSFSSPKVNIDMASLAKKAAAEAADKVVNKYLGGSGNENSEGVKNVNAEAAGKVIEKAFDLFKKKK